jgi:hypothetical protein
MSTQTTNSTALASKRVIKNQNDAALQAFIAQQLIDVWFDARSGVHLLRKCDQIVPDKGYLKSLEHPLKSWIKDRSIIRKTINELDAEIKHTRSVQYHGPIAGRRTGDIVKCSGIDWLVTTSPKLIEPAAGNWPHINRLIETMLPKQVAQDVFYSWLKIQVTAVRCGVHSASPMLILAGDAADGKTFLLKLITELRGGRSINPIKAWSGEGPVWTDHLIGAECLNIDDSAGLRDYRSRQNLATKIKESIFGDTVTVDKRHCTTFTLDPRPVWGLVMAINANGDAIKTVPALEGDDMSDKAVVLRTRRGEIFMRDSGDAGAKQRLQAYRDELPAFLYWLLYTCKNPNILVEGAFISRSGALIYRDPDAMVLIHRASPAGLFEEILNEIADKLFAKDVIDEEFKVIPPEKALTTSQILQIARTHFDRDRRIPESPNSAASYISQIAKRSDSCIVDAGENRNHSKVWIFRQRPNPES